jgi:hypothetical protein
MRMGYGRRESEDLVYIVRLIPGIIFYPSDSFTSFRILVVIL